MSLHSALATASTSLTALANTKRNTPREDAETAAPTKRKRKETTAAAGEGRFARFKAFVTDERTHKVGGLFLVLGSAYLLVAFTSFLFTWRIDQDLIGRSWREIFSPEVRAENWLGKIGALTANQFIYKWFGVAAFGLVLWSFLVGVRILLGKWLLPVKRTLGWTAMAMLWFPTVLGFLFRGEYIFLGGGIGFAITKHLTGLLGNFGTGALIVFALGAFITFTFNTSFGWLGDVLERFKPAPKEQEEAEDVAEAAAVAAVAGVRVRSVKPTAEELAAADQVLAEEESFEEAEEIIEEEEVEEVDEEELTLTEEDEAELEVAPMALELETAPMEVLTPVASPVMSTADVLETDHGVKNALDHFVEMLGVMAIQRELRHRTHYVFRDGLLYLHL
ncbi:MAG TPA: DNA translocase FtsK 4TM domain-containing protein, partial [Flavobacteriales bacterium]|nr:DNA translocase FtsK 4TM domain-containing protein [Flavobacteriales bacterium]